MPDSAICGGSPVEGVVAVPFAPGVSLTLVRSERGYCFSAWTRHDGRTMPPVADEHRERVFQSADDALSFFRALAASLESSPK
jgi:hypothetical protein